MSKVSVRGMALVLGPAVFFALVYGFWPSEDAEVLSKRARDAFMDQRYDDAEVDLGRATRIRPPTPIDWMLRAQLSMVRGKDDQAVKELAEVPDSHVMAAQARLETGQIELRRHRYIPAEKAFLQAIKLDPKPIQARRELVFIYGVQLRRAELSANFQALAKLAPLSGHEVFVWCLSRGLSWETTERLAKLDLCLKADPNDRWARLGLADCYRTLNRFDEADAVIKPLPESDPAALTVRVQVAIDREDEQAAEDLMARGPIDDLDLALIRGRFALARGNAPEAVRQFRIAHDQSPQLRETVLGLGQALKSAGDLAGAAPLLDQARKHERLGSLIQQASLPKNRDDPALLRDLGAACADLGRLPEARAWYNLAIDRDPLDRQAQQGLARIK